MGGGARGGEQEPRGGGRRGAAVSWAALIGGRVQAGGGVPDTAALAGLKTGGDVALPPPTPAICDRGEGRLQGSPESGVLPWASQSVLISTEDPGRCVVTV